MNVAYVLMVLLFAGVARAESPVEPGKVFLGPEGLTVAIVPLKPRADNKVLIQINGSGSVFDGKALPHKVEAVDRGKTNFETMYHGRGWVTIAVRDGSHALTLPGRRDSATVKFDEGRTAALKADDVYKAYQKQQADGSLRALQAFDRKQETAQEEKNLQPLLDAFVKACGSKPAIKVDWTSMTDADIQDLSIATYCGEPLDAMQRMCEQSNEAKKAISAGVKTFVCTMGKSMQLDLVGPTLNWTTSRGGTNMGDFTRRYLEKKL